LFLDAFGRFIVLNLTGKCVYSSLEENGIFPEDLMIDLLYIGLTIVFLAATWGFIEVCERLMEHKK
jgi:hypothetical protein